MRNQIVIGLLLTIFCTSAAYSQSGRRVKPLPATQPEIAAIPEYSESVPRKAPPTQTFGLFRGVGGDTIIPKRTVSEQVDDNTAQKVSDDEEEIIKIDTKLITIPMSIYDRNGIYLSDLRREELKIFENGKEQEISYFERSEKPFTVVLLIDTSPSAAYRIEEIHRAAMSFVDRLRPDDKVIVAEFDRRVRVHTTATSDKPTINDAILKARYGDGTSLYTAVDHVINNSLRNITGRKAVVLFTDGVDTTSHRANYDNTLALADRSDVAFFPIYYNTFIENRRSVRPGQMSPSGTTAGAYAVGKKYLEELSEYTGGRIYEAENSYSGLERAFAGIAEELRSQYIIGYIPNEDGTKGERRQIRVRVYRPYLNIRARDSYIVGDTTK